MKTYYDLQEAIEKNKLEDFLLAAISEHKNSDNYKIAATAYEYMCKRNVTINAYKKLLYTISGEAVPDNYSANYKLNNAFFPLFINQENEYLLGNGVTFKNESTKEKLGGDMFDNNLKKVGRAALWGGLAFGFFNLDHIEAFDLLEFVPIWDDETGALRAGIRFWQIDKNKPLRVTFYEQDGYTEYIRREQKELEVLAPKRSYQLRTRTSELTGIEILDGQNYPNFPIIPMWGNHEHQSEFIGLQASLDCYDLIQSGFANDLDDASQIYWTITNAGGMTDLDLAQFVERMRVVKAAVVDDQGSTAEAHTLDVPYAARMELLASVRSSMFNDAMALDVDKVTAGNITATAIQASYSYLDLKSSAYEECVTDFINELLKLIGVEDSPVYKPNRIINVSEETQNVLAAAQYLDQETILNHLPFLNPDEVDGIMERTQAEEMERVEAAETEEQQPEEQTQDITTEQAEALING